MTVLLQVSDPHFGTERPEVVEGLLRFAAALAPDVVVLSGDITQRATAREFRAARAFADRLAPAHVLAIPGNHDIPLIDVLARAFRPYARYCAAFGAELEPSWESAAMRVVTLNTTRPWRHKDGEVSARQVERVVERFTGAAPAQWRVAVVHQPAAVARDEDRGHLLHGHAHALRRWSEAGVDLVLGGHIHLPYVVALHERDPALPRPLWVVQAGTAVSSRVRHEAGNSVNVLRTLEAAAQRRCAIERWDWHAGRAEFGLARRDEVAAGGEAG
jgi:3',5'-cyclic AMP phosphodiesterase CpdA